MDDEATKKFFAEFNETLKRVDMTAHPRLPPDSRQPHEVTPEGIVYEDMYNALLKLFRVFYMRNRGRTNDGNVDPSLASVSKEVFKKNMQDIFSSLNVFV